MTKRPAFTLIEVSAAIAITGTVALIAYAAFRTALDTGDRIGRFREGVESSALSRNVLWGAARHVVEASTPAHPGFELTHFIGASGLPADHLAFLSRGVVAPLGASALWAIDLQQAPGGVHLTAAPASGETTGDVATILSGVAGLRVRARSAVPGEGWVESWTARQPLPTAILVEFLRPDGAPALAPLFVRLNSGGAP